MILDLHTHSVQSDDGRAKVSNYCQWIRKKELPLDGFVLTEHRQWDDESDYRDLEDEYGLLILKASEVETDYGHVLVFGVNEDLVNSFDFAKIDNPLPTCSTPPSGVARSQPRAIRAARTSGCSPTTRSGLQSMGSTPWRCSTAAVSRRGRAVGRQGRRVRLPGFRRQRQPYREQDRLLRNGLRRGNR